MANQKIVKQYGDCEITITFNRGEFEKIFEGGLL